MKKNKSQAYLIEIVVINLLRIKNELKIQINE